MMNDMERSLRIKTFNIRVRGAYPYPQETYDYIIRETKMMRPQQITISSSQSMENVMGNFFPIYVYGKIYK